MKNKKKNIFKNTGNSMFAIGVFYLIFNGIGAIDNLIDVKATDIAMGVYLGINYMIIVVARILVTVLIFGSIIYLGLKIKNAEIETSKKVKIARIALIPSFLGIPLTATFGLFMIFYGIMLIELINLNLKIGALAKAEKAS